jgi:hypothetical protein
MTRVDGRGSVFNRSAQAREIQDVVPEYLQPQVYILPREPATTLSFCLRLGSRLK